MRVIALFSHKILKVEEVRVCSLASGSNGNVYYIEYGGEAMVVDVGISYRKLKNRAMTRKVDLRKIKYIFISHEHSDHVYGLAGLSKQVGASVFMTRGTWDGMRDKYRPAPAQTTAFASGGDPVQAGPFKVFSFAKPHDVIEPCSFRVEVGGVSIGVFTDIGSPCDELVSNISKCQLVFLESNYDMPMLWAGRYPERLKQRVTSGLGHLSNIQAHDAVCRAEPANLHAIFLSHISHENNRSDIALQAFSDLADKYLVKVMSRDEASDIWSVSPTGVTKVPPVIDLPSRLDRVPLKISY